MTFDALTNENRKEEDRGRRYSVEFRESTYKRADKVIQREIEIAKIQAVQK